MSVSVAEYLGMRTDVEDPVIQPVYIIKNKKEELDKVAFCPFNKGGRCKKITSKHEPICSVRKEDGTLWINCSERLCSTKKDLELNPYQVDILHKVGKYVFSPDVKESDICVKREVQLEVTDDTNYKADYIMTLKEGRTIFSGPDRLILEMQGGGETSSTGDLTEHIKEWRNRTDRTNKFLGELVKKTNTLETNAWRRQQEQFIVKGNIAMKTWKGYGIAFCVGTLLYDYLMNKINKEHLPDLKKYNWTLAIIAFKEDTESKIEAGHIPLIVDESRVLYTNYQTFVQALINQGNPSLKAFSGEYLNLDNQPVTID